MMHAYVYLNILVLENHRSFGATQELFRMNQISDGVQSSFTLASFIDPLVCQSVSHS